ncbi:hypothetical protein GGS24DRAFT_445285 [Hypoxylon argillaceum]|nr:hypothetical protein GGS24DRAFT_445285 [Hypoxylon argillaceum]
MSSHSQQSFRSLIPVPVSPDSSRRSRFHALLVSAPPWTKHAALRSDVMMLTREEWFNVNRRIKETVDTILQYGHVIQGPGPKTYELHSHLGVALCAEIAIRPVKRPCSLANPALQRKLRAMAGDPMHTEFRHTYLNGKVWFYFRILDLEIARQPLVRDPNEL